MAISYNCDRCSRHFVGSLPELAEAVVGVRWWAPESVELMQAEIVIALIKRGHCDRHASLLAAMTGASVREESRRRSALPGTVEVRMVQLEVEPFEPLSDVAARQDGRPVVDRVRRFILNSPLSALVELDLKTRRARVTLRMAVGEESPPETVYESQRLVHTTAHEVADALRRVAAR